MPIASPFLTTTRYICRLCHTPAANENKTVMHIFFVNCIFDAGLHNEGFIFSSALLKKGLQIDGPHLQERARAYVYVIKSARLPCMYSK